MRRLDILKASLKKKEARFNNKLEEHFSDVRSANGQPLNDKRCGRSTMNRWERQNDTLRNLDKEIERTKEAIREEECKLRCMDNVKAGMPKAITDLINEGTLRQWGKYPNILFVDGVNKARIIWDGKKRKVLHKFTNSITDPEQRKKFAGVYNRLHNEINVKE